jgi:hypothetical protein
MAGPSKSAVNSYHRLPAGHAIDCASGAVRVYGTAVTLQDQHGELSAVMLGYLLTAPGFQHSTLTRPGAYPRTAAWPP